MTPVAGGFNSDSDDYELPAEKDPEFIVHIVDDDHRPPAPPLQMHRPPVLPYRLAQQLVDRRYRGEDEGPRDCTYFYFIKTTICAVIGGMAVGTLCAATSLLEEYGTGSDRVLLILGSIVIVVLALVWNTISLIVDRERC